jgi:hypothetical protein
LDTHDFCKDDASSQHQELHTIKRSLSDDLTESIKLKTQIPDAPLTAREGLDSNFRFRNHTVTYAKSLMIPIPTDVAKDLSSEETDSPYFKAIPKLEL